MNSTTHMDSWRTLASPRISAYAKVQCAPRHIKATKVRAKGQVNSDGHNCSSHEPCLNAPHLANFPSEEARLAT